MAISGDTKIVMTTNQAISIVVALVIALFFYFQIFVGGVATNVTNLRDDIKDMRQSTQSTVDKGSTTDEQLRQAIFNIDKNLAVMTTDFASFRISSQKDFDILRASFSDLDARLGKIESSVTKLSTKEGDNPFQKMPLE